MNEDIILEEEQIVHERAAEAAKFGTAVLQKPIRALATLKDPVCVPPTATVRSAIERMNEHSAGCVLVEEGDHLIGIFTERDVLTKAVGAGIDLDRTRVAQLMTRDPETLHPEDRVSFALNKMSVGGFRHIPLVDDAGRPVGVVSMRNVVDYMVELFRSEVLTLPPEPGNISRAREGA